MLSPNLTGWRAQYERFKRSYDRVTGSYLSSVEYDDDLHHFMQDCWHLKDWIKNDPSTASMSSYIDTEVHKSSSLRIVSDLANGSKHLKRNSHKEGADITSISVKVYLLTKDKPIDVEDLV